MKGEFYNSPLIFLIMLMTALIDIIKCAETLGQLEDNKKRRVTII